MSLCKYDFTKKCNRNKVCEVCENSTAYRLGYVKGKGDGVFDAINIIVQMQESAIANMMYKEDEVCEKILNAIQKELL